MNILWDYDGTLFDTYPAYAKRMSLVLNGVSEEDCYTQLKVSATHAINHFRMTEAQINEYNLLISRISPEEMPPFDHVEDVLKQADYNVIMTHKDQEGAHKVLDYYGFTTYFREIVTADHGFPRKPDPAAYEYLHNKYRIDLAVGDRELDIIPAKQLGMYTCLFQNDKPADFHLKSYRNFFDVVIF
ncbi:phosphoglycolate phosphatase [Jeotgalibacillus alimentarius]|uniref:Phosphoglycolate phosphatase n=1 Tax=Jeotgalibacillus alimentarius TaxID=135826 RepID=A0A0C2RN91_9BACL|nr:HAD-IA family hydrolase [Jeotgalibacillus alimentarius]KIL51740.1 phosphoglycolate phosphatase [Jeotgalibacillus alimentarius]